MPLIAAIATALLAAGAATPPDDAASAPAPASNELPAHIFKLLDQKQYREALALVEPLARQRNQHATYVLANYYACGKVVEFSCAKAEALFTAALESRNDAPANPEVVVAARNEVAWVNAACEQPGFTRDVEKAKVYAMAAVRDDNNAFSTDTFAAVVARTGEYVAAAAFQRIAITKLVEMAKTEPVEPYTFEEFKKRLALYEQGKPASFDESTAGQNCNALPD